MMHLFYGVFCLMLCIFFLGLLSLTCSLSYANKGSPFECGFSPSGGVRIPFCMKFFLVGVIFLIFDVEVSLLLPLPYSQTFMLLFLSVLLVGLLYEWYYGGLDWMYVNGSGAWHIGGHLFS